MPRTGPYAEFVELEGIDPRQWGRPQKARKPKPMAPFGTDHDLAVARAFDRETGEPIHAVMLKTYAEAWDSFTAVRRRSLRMGNSLTQADQNDGISRQRMLSLLAKRHIA